MTSTTKRLLNFNDSFPCPVCRQGSLEAITLTEAFACRFCRHILSADLAVQQVKVVDSTQPLVWLWNGQHWQLKRSEKEQSLSILVLLFAALLVVVPAGIVWLSGQVFPSLEQTSAITFSTLWSLTTLMAHLGLVLWLIGEYYQIPIYVVAKMRFLQFCTSAER
ncbi:MAG: hypothetical protein AAF892_03500 [Cyanobacteria bacterium P01_D01_bin.71]